MDTPDPMTLATSPLLALAAGIALLLFGRQIYWALVGALGFIAGLIVAEMLLGDRAGLIVVALAVVAGVLGAVLAVVLQRVMVALAGFAIGGQLAATLFSSAPSLVDGVPFATLPYLIGGVVGAVLVFLVFDLALIVLSSLMGAALVTRVVGEGGTIVTVVFVAAFLLGAVVQFLQMQRRALPVVEQP